MKIQIRTASRRALDSDGNCRWFCAVCGKGVMPGQRHQVATPYRMIIRACLDCVPRPSHLSPSEKRQRVYQAREALEDALRDFACTGEIEALKEAIEAAWEIAYEVATEYYDAYEATGAAFAEVLESASSCEEWAEELRGLDLPDFEVDSDSSDSPEDQEELWRDQIITEVEAVTEGLLL
jgi:hypothetical protein